MLVRKPFKRSHNAWLLDEDKIRSATIVEGGKCDDDDCSWTGLRYVCEADPINSPPTDAADATDATDATDTDTDADATDATDATDTDTDTDTTDTDTTDATAEISN